MRLVEKAQRLVVALLAGRLPWSPWVCVKDPNVVCKDYYYLPSGSKAMKSGK